MRTPVLQAQPPLPTHQLRQHLSLNQKPIGCPGTCESGGTQCQPESDAFVRLQECMGTDMSTWNSWAGKGYHGLTFGNGIDLFSEPEHDSKYDYEHKRDLKPPSDMGEIVISQ